MQKQVQPAVDRFNALNAELKESFYEKDDRLCRFYSFISQIIPWSDAELEMLYSYGRFLIPFLTFGDDTDKSAPGKRGRASILPDRKDNVRFNRNGG